MSERESRRPYGHPTRGLDPMEPHGTTVPTGDPMAHHRPEPTPCTTRGGPDPMHQRCSVQPVKG